MRDAAAEAEAAPSGSVRLHRRAPRPESSGSRRVMNRPPDAPLHRRAAVLERDCEDDSAAPDDGIDVVDVTGDELLEDALRAVVAGGVERAPQRVAVVHLLDADRGRRGARLEHPRRHHAARPVGDLLIVEHRRELRHRHAERPRLHPHRQLVSEPARRRPSQARDAQVLTQHRAELDVEVVERGDPIDAVAAPACRHGGGPPGRSRRAAPNGSRRSPRAAIPRRPACRWSAAGRCNPAPCIRAGRRRP